MAGGVGGRAGERERETAWWGSKKDLCNQGLVPMVGITKIIKKYSIHEDMWAQIKDLPEI